MDNLAPISISTYNRYEHLQKTVEALQQNFLASDSVLYIFSDAPKSGDEKDVAKVRKYMDSISGFQEVVIIKQETNNYAKNMKESSSIPLARFGKVIRMEDDIVTSPHFLTYMNNALELYKDEKSIFAVLGYTPDIDEMNKLESDIYLSKIFSAWGFGLWDDRGFLDAREKLDYYSEMKKKKELVKEINQNNPNMMNMLQLIESKKANPGDYKISAYILLNNLFTIAPKRSLIKNIGNDGSGIGGSKTDKFELVLDKNFLPIVERNLSYNNRWDRLIYNDYFNKDFLRNIRYKLLLKSRVMKLNLKDKKIARWLKRLIGKFCKGFRIYD